MSVLKLDPQEENAPKYLRKYYHGYTPELYKEIVDLWKGCKRIDIKRWTALDYAKRAQEKDLEQKKEKEFEKYRDYEFINFKDDFQRYFKDEGSFVSEFKRHLKALIIHLCHNFVYARRDVKITIQGYLPYSNRIEGHIWNCSLDVLATELDRGTIYTYDSLARIIWDKLMKDDTQNIQKRSISGWKIYGDLTGKNFYIDFLYDPTIRSLIKNETDRRNEEYRKNHPTPDAMGYHGGPGHYTGD